MKEIKVWESCLNDACRKTHDSVVIKMPKNIKNPKFLKCKNPKEKCMKSFNLMKKSAKVSYLKSLKKAFESLTKKNDKFFFFGEKGSREESERKTKE